MQGQRRLGLAHRVYAHVGGVGYISLQFVQKPPRGGFVGDSLSVVGNCWQGLHGNSSPRPIRCPNGPTQHGYSAEIIKRQQHVSPPLGARPTPLWAGLVVTFIPQSPPLFPVASGGFRWREQKDLESVTGGVYATTCAGSSVCEPAL